MDYSVDDNVAIDTPMYDPKNTETTENVVENIVTLDTIHNDLGVITIFLVLFSVVLLINYIYRFFKIFF